MTAKTDTQETTMTNTIDPIAEPVETDPEMDGHNTEPETPEPEPAEPDDKGNRESAKYRKRAQEAETALDAVAGQLTTARTHIVAAQLSRGVTVEALTAAGHTIDDMFTEDGTVDTDLLDQALKDTATRFGLQDRGLIVPSEGSSPISASSRGTWGSLLSGDDN